MTEFETGPLGFMNNPDVQRVLPHIIGSLVWRFAFCSTLGFRPDLTGLFIPECLESDRQQAKDALDAAGFAPRIDVTTGAHR